MIYLLPVVTNGKGTVMEYRIDLRKRDMRTTFCKRNEKYLISQEQFNKISAKIKNGRIILPNAKAARELMLRLKNE